ncbi:MAG: hypothetical protein ACRELC_04195 [Gemmatimonadota bacterium]
MPTPKRPTRKRTATGGFVRIGDTDYGVLPRWTVDLVDDPEIPYDLHLELAIEDGRQVCEEIRIVRRPGGPEITGEALRRVPVVRLAREHLPPVFKVLERKKVKGKTITRLGLTARPADVEEVAAAIERPRGSARTIGADELRAVADAVRVAVAFERPTGPAVADALQVSPSHARRLIQRARDEIDPDTGEPYLERVRPSRKSSSKSSRRRTR